MVSRFRPRVLDIVMSKFGENSFSVCILSALNGFVHEDLGKGVSFHYKVPENLCRKHVLGQTVTEAQFSASAIMATFDEISTYATIMQDKTHRPGLSVHLSTEIIRNVHAGEEVTILTKADKLGKSIGYCSMELLNNKGELVARGKHIRYLQMGRPFDFLTHPFVLPWTLKVYETIFGKKTDSMATTGPTAGQGEHIFKVPKHFPTLDGLGRIFEHLGLTPATVSVVEHTGSSNGSNGSAVQSAEDKLVYCSNDGRVGEEHVSRFDLTVRPIICNMLGSMHGGAVGCAVEHAGLLARCRTVPVNNTTTTTATTTTTTSTNTSISTTDTSNSTNTINTTSINTTSTIPGHYNTDCYVTSLEVRYIAAMKGELQITVVEDLYAPLLPADSTGKQWSTKTFGKVLSKKDDSVCAEYVCTWALHSQ